MMKFSDNNYVQKKFEQAIEKTSLEEVVESLCGYVTEEDLQEFIGYYCDAHNCFPKEDDEDED